MPERSGIVKGPGTAVLYGRAIVGLMLPRPEDSSRVAFRASLLIVAGMVAGLFLGAVLGLPPWTVGRVLQLLLAGAALLAFAVLVMSL
jgi:hypothetical protein